jgi:hypothetical protein
MTSHSEVRAQESIKAKVLSAINTLSAPFDASVIASLAKITPSQVSHYLTTMYQQKKLRRARDVGALKRLKFLYAKPEWDLPGYDLIDRRKAPAYKRKRMNAYRSTESVAQPTRVLHAAPQLSIRLASKDLSLSISEARALHDELGKLFGDLARPS